MNDEQQKEPVRLVSALRDALKYVVTEYGKHMTEADKSDCLQVIAELEEHDRDLTSHVFMLDRRISTLARRIVEAKKSGEIEARTDIPWVRQELSMLRWAAKRT